MGFIQSQHIPYTHSNQSQQGSPLPLTFRLCAWVSLGSDYQHLSDALSCNPVVHFQDMALFIACEVLNDLLILFHHPISMHQEMFFLVFLIEVCKKQLGVLPHFP